MARTRIPPHMRKCEIKRRLTAMVETARVLGLEIGGVRMTANGEITLLDKSGSPSESDSDEKWLGS